MAEITASLVKDLRDKTGAGMMDCKKALSETAGDIEAAVDWLRKKGLSTAAKKSGRTAAEGLVGVTVSGKTGAVVEVNSETDFVAKNDIFQGFVRNVTELSVTIGGDIEKLGAATYPGTSKTVSEQLTENIATIGENQTLRRAATLTVSQGAVSSYVHNAASAGLGKIGVLVAVESEASVEALGKQLAMQIAAVAPLAVDASGVDAALVARERAIAEDKAAQSGKPADVQAKMVDGAIRKFLEENTLMGQASIMDGKTKVADVIAAAAKEAGKAITVTAFVRYQLGEGIEKATSDFAAEVAAAMGN
jgi:elongation factor Ts